MYYIRSRMTHESGRKWENIFTQRTWVSHAEGVIRKQLSPAVNHIPPDDFEPFLKSGFCPFAMTPPLCAKDSGVLCGGGGPFILRQLFSEDGEGTGCMPVACYQQYLMGMRSEEH